MIPGTVSGDQGAAVSRSVAVDSELQGNHFCVWRYQIWKASRKPVVCVKLPDLEGHQYWQSRKCWISQTACSKAQRSLSGNYPSRLVSHIAWPIQLKKKRLGLHSYNSTAVHELKPGSSAKQVAYCKWFLDFLDHEGEDILDVTFFTDEAYFYLSGYINSQNSCVWCAHNPHAFHESLLHDEKIGVWVGMSRRRIVGPSFFLGDSQLPTVLWQYCVSLHCAIERRWNWQGLLSAG
jgi:hypothetical protein